MGRSPGAGTDRAAPAKDTTAGPTSTGGESAHPAGETRPPFRALSRARRPSTLPHVLVFDLRPIERLARNLAQWDRIVRIGLGLLFVVLPLSGAVTGLAGTALLVLAWVPLVTGAIGWCPIYSLLGASTKKR